MKTWDTATTIALTVDDADLLSVTCALLYSSRRLALDSLSNFPVMVVSARIMPHRHEDVAQSLLVKIDHYRFSAMGADGAIVAF